MDDDVNLLPLHHDSEATSTSTPPQTSEPPLTVVHSPTPIRWGTTFVVALLLYLYDYIFVDFCSWPGSMYIFVSANFLVSVMTTIFLVAFPLPNPLRLTPHGVFIVQSLASAYIIVIRALIYRGTCPYRSRSDGE